MLSFEEICVHVPICSGVFHYRDPDRTDQIMIINWLGVTKEQLGELTCKIDIVYVKLGTHDHLWHISYPHGMNKPLDMLFVSLLHKDIGYHFLHKKLAQCYQVLGDHYKFIPNSASHDNSVS